MSAFLALEVMLLLGLQSSCKQDNLRFPAHLNMAFSRAENNVYTKPLQSSYWVLEKKFPTIALKMGDELS